MKVVRLLGVSNSVANSESLIAIYSERETVTEDP